MLNLNSVINRGIQIRTLNMNDYQPILLNILYHIYILLVIYLTSVMY